MVCRYSISEGVKSRAFTVWMLMTPIVSSPAMSGADSIEVKRSSSTPWTHLKRGSARTSRAASGTRAFATQPVMPSPTASLARPMPRRFRPFVATSVSVPSRLSRR